MTVKRWSIGVDGPDENGNLVAYADYLSLAAENSSLRLTIGNIVNALKLGDGPVSQQVIELVTGLVAERDALAAKLNNAEDVVLSSANEIAYAIFNLSNKKLSQLKKGLVETTCPTDSALIAERNLRKLAAILRSGGKAS